MDLIRIQDQIKDVDDPGKVFIQLMMLGGETAVQDSITLIMTALCIAGYKIEPSIELSV